MPDAATQNHLREVSNIGLRAIAQIPNIGPRGQQQRLRLGVIALAAAALVAGVLFGLGAPRSWRLILVAPLWIAGLGFFQARDKT